MNQSSKPIRLIALDLDGTLLNSDKQLSPRNRDALARAAAQGVQIVPTTGRFFSAIPECVRELPFINYAITINGAYIYDIRRDAPIATADFTLENTLSVMRYLDQFPVLYDCYYQNKSYISRHFWEHAEQYVSEPHFLAMLKGLRTPVDDLKTFLEAEGRGVQKIMVFTTNAPVRQKLLDLLPDQFPQILVSTSYIQNIEINAGSAHKGIAIRTLAEHLGLTIDQVAAFGDGTNDISMLRAAGTGIAMANAWPEVLEIADMVTLSNDEDGVAAALEKLGL